MLEIFIVGGGGCIGSILRYFVTKAVENNFPTTTFPYGVMLANVVGCLLIGLISGLSMDKISLTPNLRLFFFVGKEPFVQLGVVVRLRPRIMVYALVDRKLGFGTTPLQRLDHTLRFLKWNNLVGVSMKDPNRFFHHLISI